MVKKTRLKKREYIDKVDADLDRLLSKKKGGRWRGEQLVAYNIRKVLLGVHAMAKEFLEDHSPERWRKVCGELYLIEVHYNALRNIGGKTKQELDSLAKDHPSWLMYAPLVDVKNRLERLEEHGE